MSQTPFKRKRVTKYRYAKGVETATYEGRETQRNELVHRLNDVQTTWSGETSWPQFQQQLRRKMNSSDDVEARERLRRQDFGQDFLTVRNVYRDEGGFDRPFTGLRASWLGTTHRYSGPLFARYGGDSIGGNFPSYSEVDLHMEMKQRGATAIARVLPTNPVVGASTALGESLERLPKFPGAAIFGKAGNVSKRFADEYLNLEFGLKPLASDVRKTAQAVKDHNKILEQLERDSGRIVRRRYNFPVETSTIVLEESNRTSYPVLADAFYPGLWYGPYTLERTTVKRMWFSGAFTYHYETGSDLRSRLKANEQKANLLFGMRLDADLIWELAPWSWAADWKSNTGDVIKNLSSFGSDGLVLMWGYVMCDLRIIDTHTLVDPLVGRLVQRLETRVKKRVHATPFGFGLDPDWKDFTSRQLAILGALGISRGR